MAPTRDQHVLVLANGRDVELTCDILARAGVRCEPCTDQWWLSDGIAQATGALICAAECLTDAVRERLKDILKQQPPWSDLPVLIVASPGDPGSKLAEFALLRSVSVLQRPLPIDTLVTAVQSALRARARQYQVRDLLREREEADRRKDDFLAMLAHELRNPLAPVRYGVQVLREEAAIQDDKAARALALVDRQVSHMGRLIEDLLDVSRITRGLIELQPEPVELGALIRQVIDGRAEIASGKRATTAFSQPNDPVWVNGDRIRLMQAIENLVENAEKFSPADGRVEVTVSRDDGDAVVSVSDNGEGIDADTLAHLFEMCTQADRTLDRSKGGLGIGLSMVSGIVALHGGSITALSDGLDKGATFIIRLPLGTPPAAASLPNPTLDGNAEKVALKVLVAEDNRDAAEMLRLLLKRYGHRVEIAHSGLDAIEAAKHFRPDILLCDIGLPGMSGYEVAQTLSQNPLIRPPRLVAVTGYSGEEHRLQAIQAGFDAHLVKPVNIPDLLNELRQVSIAAGHRLHA